MLTTVLSWAVPDVYVESAEIVKSSARAVCWIRVSPNHDRYWKRFKEVYPYCLCLAQECGAEIRLTACPEFCAREALIDWLSDTLRLTQGERNLLHLMKL